MPASSKMDMQVARMQWLV